MAFLYLQYLMKYFTKDFNQFFIDLAGNNHKDWFHENKKRYENSVKKPFDAFIADALVEIAKHDPTVTIPAKDAIFRINRDVRFSKDKSLYKLNRSAILSSAGRKDHSVPGMYVMLSPEHVSLGGGSYFLQADQLQKLRERIAAEPKRFMQITTNKAFVKIYGGLQGEENKRLPKEFKEVGEEYPIIFKKQYFYMAQHAPSLVESEALMDTLLAHYQAAFEVQQYLKEAIA